ncbi:MAG: SusE domain-containing protein, partial [Pyrinomonadaceae bacterium]|nr:SusE domain-containing protein [Sphingobacteriaceae bacterium]
MKKILPLFLLCLLTIVSCKKYDYSIDSKGEALGTFKMSSPSSNTMIVLNSATPNVKVKLSWTASTPGVSVPPTYKWVAILKGGDFAAPYLEMVSDNNGLAPTLTLTYKQIDDLLKAKTIAEGVKVDLIWSVFADNGSVKVKSEDEFNVSITRAGDGVSNFVLYGPLSSTTVVEINPNSTTEMLNFKWQKSVAGKIGSAITYKVKFISENGNFNTPLFQFVSNNNGSDSTFSISNKDFDAALTAAGLADQATPAVLKWSVEATSGAFTKFSDYVNQFSIKREVKLFMVGGDTPIGWTAEDAIQMIPDASNPGTYFAYIKLTTGNGGFKFLNQRQWPGGALNSSDWGMKPGTPGDAAEQGESNIENYGATGIYRVTFDQKNLKYYVEADKGRMGAVGGATPKGWSPPDIFPTQGLFYVSANKFLGFVNLQGASEYKFIDNDAWGNGTLTGSRDYGKGATDGLMLESQESNINSPASTGDYRLIWDG